jgi:hypothetical protein
LRILMNKRIVSKSNNGISWKEVKILMEVGYIF